MLIKPGIGVADGEANQDGRGENPGPFGRTFVIPSEPPCHGPRPSTGRGLEPTGDPRRGTGTGS